MGNVRDFDTRKFDTNPATAEQKEKFIKSFMAKGKSREEAVMATKKLFEYIQKGGVTGKEGVEMYHRLAND
jgi:hypothetical protein